MNATQRSDEEVAQAVRQRLDMIELLRREAAEKGKAFTALPEDELQRKERGETANSPYIYAQSWSSMLPAGATATYRVYVHNPDPTGYYPLFVTIFFGMANFGRDTVVATAGRHLEWPYVSSESFGLGTGASTDQYFSYPTPTQVLKGTYTGNSVLWRGDVHDIGSYLDRGLFYVTVT